MHVPEVIVMLPAFGELPNQLTVPILIKLGDDVSTDDIIRAGDILNS